MRALKIGHAARIGLAWLVVSAVGMVLVATVLAPHLPPGNASTEASGQRHDNEVLTLVSVPIIALVLIYFGYVLVAFRERGPATAATDGPPIRGHMRVQTAWVVVTTATVLFLAAFGTYELLGGAGGGQGPHPVFVPDAQAAVAGPKDPPLQVQVIAQQWQFTYRYPSLGGIESNQLYLPADTDVELHVTSLDAIHSFWAYELGVKADANPGVDNVVFVQTKGPGTFHVRCAELCGLWHGYMFNNGRVVESTQFNAWASQQRKLYAAIKPFMDKPEADGGAPYSKTYFPAPDRRAG